MKSSKIALFFIIAIAIAAACHADPQRFAVQKSGSGSPMIFIPGLNSPGSVWQGMADHYAGHYETYTLTLAGFAGVPLQGEPSLRAVKDELVSYLREHDLNKVVLVGHSLGGFLALWVSAEVPDRVSRVVIVDSLPFFPLVWNPSATEDNMRESARQQTQGIAASTEESRRQYYTQNTPALVSGEKDIAAIVKASMDSDPRMTAQSMYEMYTTDLRDELANIKAPILVLGSCYTAKMMGGSKESVEAQFETQYRNGKHVKIFVHDTAKHFIMLDDLAWIIKHTDAFL